ncbi:MAG: hypothetical protein NTV37_04800 [Proteobacteria bacterium]|nr:hypothetical protein [Pseudomonadota bacterium]
MNEACHAGIHNDIAKRGIFGWLFALFGMAVCWRETALRLCYYFR